MLVWLEALVLSSAPVRIIFVTVEASALTIEEEQHITHVTNLKTWSIQDLQTVWLSGIVHIISLSYNQAHWGAMEILGII